MSRNVAGELASEIARVTEIRERYNELRGRPAVNLDFGILLMDRVLAVAVEAAGIDDAVTQLSALQSLKEVTG